MATKFQQKTAAIAKHEANLRAVFNIPIENSYKLYERLLRQERTMRELALKSCNEGIREGEWERAERNCLRSLVRILGQSASRIFIYGDPRGYQLKLKLKEGEVLHTDFAGYGIIAPDFNGD